MTEQKIFVGYKPIICLVLALCMLAMQLAPAYAAHRPQDAVRVAYLAIGFENVIPEQQQNITTRISVLLSQEPRLYYIPQSEIAEKVPPALLTNIRQQLKKEDFQKVARLLDADFLFAGHIQNQSRDAEYAALTGSMVRYDVATDNLYRLSIKTFFEDFNEELIRINEQLIRTIVPEKREGVFRRYLPGILIVAATAMAVLLLLGGTNGQSTGGGGSPTPP